MTEATLSKRIVNVLNAIPGCHAEKRWTGGTFSRVGASDITGCYHGRRFELETKLPGEKTRIAQQRYLEAWARAGAYIGVVTSTEEAVNIVESIS